MKALRRARVKLGRTTVSGRSPHHTILDASSVKPLESLIIANRGEIALRVKRTAERYGIRTTTLYTDPDATSQHALSSPFSVNLGDSTAYLNGDVIIKAAKQQGCDGVHPGYGFLSENAPFAKKCKDAGLVFIGPPPEAIAAMGDKSRSKEIMSRAGVPCVPGYHGSNQNSLFLKSEAHKIGFPVLLKAVKGGGGKGMRISQSAEDFFSQLDSAKSEARSSFGDDTMLVEKYITAPRHIEVQVFADKHGNCVALGERDCSVQRRHQKIIEESPAPNLEDPVRKDLWSKARAAAIAVDYEGAGTVEFIFDNDSGGFYFMEMNTRLQVEHPVTEMITAQDLVHWQLQVAAGKPLPLTQEEVEEEMSHKGWAFEARIYAEDPQMNFMPDSGILLHLRTPQESDTVRVDGGFVAGDEISPYYDPMIAKLIVHGSDRLEALRKLRAALEQYEIAGPATNVGFLKNLCAHPQFIEGNVETGFIEKNHADLFADQIIPDEVWAQTAINILKQEGKQEGNHQDSVFSLALAGSTLGFGSQGQTREIRLSKRHTDRPAEHQSVKIEVKQVSPNTYDVNVDDRSFTGVRSQLKDPKSLESFFPHSRLTTTVVRDNENLTVFQQGVQYDLQYVRPKWTEKVLGITDVANSVIAPMPCKVLRVDVQDGEEVRRDQSLVVIESMKMETVVRSPQDGTVSKVVHKQGDICKAGTALVEFASPNDN